MAMMFPKMGNLGARGRLRRKENGEFVLAMGKLKSHIQVKMLEIWRSRWRLRLEIESWESLAELGWIRSPGQRREDS